MRFVSRGPTGTKFPTRVPFVVNPTLPRVPYSPCPLDSRTVFGFEISVMVAEILRVKVGDLKAALAEKLVEECYILFDNSQDLHNSILYAIGEEGGLEYDITLLYVSE